MNAPQIRPVIGITLGDINGIGPELIIKTFADSADYRVLYPGDFWIQ